MNLRLSADTTRIRISAQEAKWLLSGKALSEAFVLPFAPQQDVPFTLMLAEHPQSIALLPTETGVSICAQHLRQLLAQHPNKKGLAVPLSTSQALFLEIDSKT